MFRRRWHVRLTAEFPLHAHFARNGRYLSANVANVSVMLLIVSAARQFRLWPRPVTSAECRLATA